MAKVEQWQERGIQVMVLLSLVLQLLLLVLAEFRRRMDSGVLRAVVWSAYMLADSTAIYTLGHLSVTSRSSDHELMAFWAPFLLLHLGGQDNITAYAIEDNRLWLRHMQALAVQVAAAAYVLYGSTIVGTQVMLRNASILMFVLGIVKYGERVWALKHANTSASSNKYRSFDMRTHSSNGHPTDRRDTEGLFRIAYLLLDVPKDLMQGPLPNLVLYLDGDNDIITADELYKVVEMQISLMHDVVYSKAEVIHTWYGLCIRVISPVFTATAFMLFHGLNVSADDHRHNKADVVITYVLLVGAATLEIISVLRVMFSRWPSVILGKLAHDVDGGKRCMWGLLSNATASIRRFVLRERNSSRWWWSNSMGQHNLIDLCIGSRASRRSRIAGCMGLEDWWNTLIYSSSISVSKTIKKLVVEKLLGTNQGSTLGYFYSRSTAEGQDHIINSRGWVALRKWYMDEELEQFLNMELDESILVWHIATDIYLRWHKDQGQAIAAADDVRRLAEATEAISNYMLFLLAARPYMLPDSVGRDRYVELCYCLTGLEYNTTQDLVSLLLSSSPAQGAQDIMPMYFMLENIKDGRKERCIRQNKTLRAVHALAEKLVDVSFGPPPAAKLDMLAGVWAEMLCYAAYKCSGYSHAKQLSNGGELLTVAALFVEYYRRNVLKPDETVLLSSSSSGSERRCLLWMIPNSVAMLRNWCGA